MDDASAESKDIVVQLLCRVKSPETSDSKTSFLATSAGDQGEDRTRISVSSEDSGTIMLLAVTATLQNNVQYHEKSLIGRLCDTVSSSVKLLTDSVINYGDMPLKKDLADDDCETEILDATCNGFSKAELDGRVIGESTDNSDKLPNITTINNEDINDTKGLDISDVTESNDTSTDNSKVRTWAEVVASLPKKKTDLQTTECDISDVAHCIHQEKDQVTLKEETENQSSLETDPKLQTYNQLTPSSDVIISEENQSKPEPIVKPLVEKHQKLAHPETNATLKLETNVCNDQLNQEINSVKIDSNFVNHTAPSVSTKKLEVLAQPDSFKKLEVLAQSDSPKKLEVLDNKGQVETMREIFSQQCPHSVVSWTSYNENNFNIPCADVIEIIETISLSSNSPEATLNDEGTASCCSEQGETGKHSKDIEVQSVCSASDKPDLGLEELSSLNVKSKFQVFEKGSEKGNDLDRSPSKVDVKRSPSILSKLAKFQKKGMDVGVTDEDLDGFAYEESSSEEEEEEDEVDDAGVIKCRKVREKPMSFGKMDDVKKNFESGATNKEQRMEERKQEIQHLRSRLFQGKQVKMKEMYEQAVAESEGKVSRKESDVVRSDKAKEFRERFEKGQVVHSDEEDDSKSKIAEEMTVFEEGISKKSRSLFLEMDAKTQSDPKPRQQTPLQKPKSQEQDNSPDREIYRDPTVIRAEDKLGDELVIMKSQTASKMLSIFKQMEEHKEVLPDGPKPKKEFTPPPDYRGVDESSEEEEDEEEDETESEEEEDDDGIIKSSSRVEDDYLEGKAAAVKARELAAKFESWEPEKQSGNNAVSMLESEQPSLESTKSLRAHFESLKNQKNEQESKSRPKVNRFVDGPQSVCFSCETKVYALEKIETDGRIFHKVCFKCSHCRCILRMDSYTLNNGHLYCMPHFKQLFISKGNYDEGFGVDQHKRKWELSGTPVNGSA